MKLSSIYNIFENVEALIPHLKSIIINLVKKELEKIENKGGDIYQIRYTWNSPDIGPAQKNLSKSLELSYDQAKRLIENPTQPAKWLDKAIERILQSDPKYLKDVGKPLNRRKAPFAKDIIRWWLIDGSIELPEDIQTTGETLKAYNRAQQKGLKLPINIISWPELAAAVEPYIEHVDQTEYDELGYNQVFADGPWKIYCIDEWIDGAESELYPGQIQHAVMGGTSWCVKYKNNFNSYSQSGKLYLILYKNKRLALMHPTGKEIKNILDVPLGTPDKRVPADRTQKEYELFSELLPKILESDFGKTFVIDYALKSRGDEKGNFTIYFKNNPELNQQMYEVLNNPAIKETIVENADYKAINQIIRLNKNPTLKDWPEALELLLENQKNSDAYKILKDILQARAQNNLINEQIMGALQPYAWVPLIRISQEYLDIAINEYDLLQKFCDPNKSGWVLRETLNSALEIIKISNLDQNIINDFFEKLVQSIVVEPRLLVSYLLQIVPLITNPGFADKAVLKTSDPIVMAIWAVKFRGEWPEAEDYIAKNKKAVSIYSKIETTNKITHKIDIKTAQDAVAYAITINDEVPQFEDLILTDLDTAIRYSEEIIGPWPELEELLEQHGSEEQKIRYSRI